MSTTEIIIVFSALMALIALVTIGIDWIGKPLKHRRFIPRLYRFDDEKLPVDAYGHPQLDAHRTEAALSAAPIAGAPPWAPPAIYEQPPPVVVATVPEPLTSTSAPEVLPLPGVGESAAAELDAESTLDYDAFMERADGHRRDDHADDSHSTSAFSDRLLSGTSGAVPVVDDAAWAATGLVPGPGDDAPVVDVGETIEFGPNTPAAWEDDAENQPISVTAWEPGMALDATVNDERPSMATKAERYWQATAAAVETSHFAADAIDRMAGGRAPRRRNPRTNRVESMQLTGLRRASTRADVRMSWPDSSVDPWAAS